MSKKTALIILILSSILLGSWLTYYFSDRQVIKRQLAALAMEISKEVEETPLQMALKMGRLKNRLLNPCQVVIPERNDIHSLEPDSILRYLMYYRQRYAQISITLEQVEINLTSGEEAMVQTTVHLLRQTTLAQTDAMVEIQPIELILIKHETVWQIKQVTIPESLTQ
jgi:hypothetical protein